MQYRLGLSGSVGKKGSLSQTALTEKTSLDQISESGTGADQHGGTSLEGTSTWASQQLD